MQKSCKLDIAKLGSFLLTRHYNFEGKILYCKNTLKLAQIFAKSTLENLPVPRKSRKFAPDKETKTPNAMNTNEKTWTVQPKTPNEKYGKNVYNNKAYAEFVKETLCKDTGFEWVIIESN